MTAGGEESDSAAASGPEATPRRPWRQLLWFFLLTYGTTWLLWTAAKAIAAGPTPALAGAVFLLGTFAPGLIALALTQVTEGGDATRALVRRVFRWQVGAGWYGFALAFMPVIKLTVALLHRLATGAWPRFGDEPWVLMAGAILISTWAQAGEEIGWRGYALPRLSERLGLASSSLILGIIWAAWHLPLFFVPGANTFGQSFPLYLTQVTAVSVTMAWVYWRTGGSLLLVMVLHAAINNTKDIVPSAEAGATDAFALSSSMPPWLTVALLWLAAIYFLARMRGVKALRDRTRPGREP